MEPITFKILSFEINPVSPVHSEPASDRIFTTLIYDRRFWISSNTFRNKMSSSVKHPNNIQTLRGRSRSEISRNIEINGVQPEPPAMNTRFAPWKSRL